MGGPFEWMKRRPDWSTHEARAVADKPEAAPAAISIPADWQIVDSESLISPAVVAAGIEPDPGDGTFRANVTLTASAQRDLSFADWQNQTDEELPSKLAEYLVIDLEHVSVAGQPGGRRLAHYVGGDDVCLVMEQWSVIQAEIGWTLTWTIDVLRYHELAEIARESVAMLRLPQVAS